jgi:hypothetical protein
MNRGADSLKSRLEGYTIVEVMIFLAVSSLLFVTTMLTLSGRQNRVEFVNVVRDFETKLTDIANDVATGYYQVGSTNFTCDHKTPPAQRIIGSGGSDSQGEHKGCIFLGRLVKLGQDVGTNNEGYGIYSMVGNRTVGPAASSANVASLSEANPSLLWTDNDITNQELREEKLFGFGTKVACIGTGAGVVSCRPNVDTQNAGIAFITHVNGVPGKNETGSGIRAELHVYSAITIPDKADDFITDITANSPAESTVVCLLSGTTNQYALIYLGSAGGSGLTIKSEIYEGTTCGA